MNDVLNNNQKYPMADSIEKQQIRREQQKLHRAELHLARLKTKIKKARQTDARMKLRLGNLAFLTNWEKMGLAEIEQRIIQIKSVLEEKNDHTEIRQKGQKALDRLAHHPEKKTKSENKESPVTSDEWRALNHQKITIGGLFVKHNIGQINRATLFGAMLNKNENLEKR